MSLSAGESFGKASGFLDVYQQSVDYFSDPDNAKQMDHAADEAVSTDFTK